MRKILLFFAFMLAFLPKVSGQTGQIGTGTATSSYLPVYSCYGYNYSQQLYMASELTAAIGTTNTVITKIRFYVSGTADPQANYNQWVVYLGNTTKTSFASTTDWVPAAQMSMVYSGTLPNMTAGTWVELPLSTPFVWNGTGNLVVAVNETAPSYSCTASWGAYTSTSNTGMYYYSDSVIPNPASPPTASSRVASIPRLQFDSAAPSSCTYPTAVTTSAVTSNSAQVSWTAPTPAPANGYDVYYNTTGVAPNATTVLNASNSVQATASPATISGLAGSTTYYVWVRAKCASGQSIWFPATSPFTTLCAPVTALPWVENFDSMTSIGAGIVPVCWKQIAGTKPWTSSNAAATTPYNGPKSAPNYMSLQYGNTNASQLWTPGFSLTAGTNYEFSFYYNTGGTGSSYVGYSGDVLVNTSQTATGATTLGTFITATQGTDNYTLYKINYTPTTSGVYNFGLSVTATSAPWYLGVDDFKLRVAPTCLDPQGLNISNVTASSATLQWTVPTPAPAGGYDIYYTTSTAYPASTVTPQYPGVSGPTQLISGLAATTTYYVWIRARCSATDIGDWTAVAPFTTPCTSITALPWTENFDAMTTLGAGIVPNCWKQITGTNAWTSSNSTSNNNGPRSAPNFMRLQYSSTNASQLWTPGFALTAGTTYEFSFYYNTGGTTSSYIGFTGNVLVNTAQTATGATTLGAFITATQGTDSYKLYKVYFTPTTSGTYNFGLSASATSAPWYLGVDDFKLRVAPTCLDPQGLNIVNVTTSSATIQWTVPTPAPAGGYDVYYTTSTATPLPTVTPQYPGVSGPTQLISGLTASTTYYIWVRARCSATDIGDWTGPLKVYTNYCAPTTGTSTSYYLKNITTTGGFTNLAYTATTYSAYVNNSATSFSVLPGSSVNVTMGSSTTSSYYYYLWIDWNNDMVFDPATETVYATTSPITTGGTTTVNSAGHASGSYRARFGTSWSGTITPCGPASYGNYVDFTFIIKPCSTTAPTNVYVDAIAHNAATVHWTASPDNQNYKVYWREVGTTGWPNSSPLLSPPTNSYIMTTGLLPVTNYEVKVVAVCNTTEGNANPVSFVTRCDPTPPNVTISNITPTSGLITWSPLAASSTYIMRWREVGPTGPGVWHNVTLPSPPTNTYTLGGLSPYTTYEVQVANQCIGDPNPNPYSNPKAFTTERVCELPPPGLTITQLFPTSAEVKWDPFPGATYVLRYRKVGIPSWTEIPSVTSTLVLNGLTELTKYEMQVVNICNGTPGAYTPPYYFTTPTVVYCNMGSTSAAAEYISRVTVKPNGKLPMDNTSGASTYTDYTGVPKTFIELIQGSTDNEITIEKKWTGASYNDGIAVWIDFNRNGEFDISERVFTSPPNTTSPVTGKFNVPVDAFVSMTDYKYVVMRVAMQRDGIPVNCTSFANGEVEDYTVRISKKAVPNPTDQTDILIYPNPVSTVLYVKNISKKAKYKIYNVAGQVISNGILLNNQINVSRLINGVYVIDIDDNGNTVQKKFIKE